MIRMVTSDLIILPAAQGSRSNTTRFCYILYEHDLNDKIEFIKLYIWTSDENKTLYLALAHVQTRQICKEISCLLTQLLFLLSSFFLYYDINGCGLGNRGIINQLDLRTCRQVG